ncbi:hypothetical protein [Oligoflexus tunisiensis]|uniref:hypothetical protein n=1 Tax=Oligoflexus tunisiensis TaxID=708132 RepID=UPI00114D20D3|nr:hypothetical protein [Oligoflexus tunisiensis]
MKALALTFVTVTFVSLGLSTACGSGSDEDEAAATSSYTYVADTKAIIDGSCATTDCHAAGSVNKPMTTLDEIKAIGPTKMITRLKATDSTRMPQDDSTFETSEEGKILLDWLAGGADLK